VAWQTNVLVVANRTAGSEELIEALKERAARGSTAFTLLLPCTAGAAREESRARLDDALARMRTAGLEVVGKLGTDPNPLFALTDIWDPATFDEVVISTFPTGVSHWLNADLPQRVARLTDAPVAHVVSKTTPPPPRGDSAPRRHAVSGDAGDFVARFFGGRRGEGRHVTRH